MTTYKFLSISDGSIRYYLTNFFTLNYTKCSNAYVINYFKNN